MMSRLSCVIIFFLYHIVIYAQEIPVKSRYADPCVTSNAVFQGGERVVYKVYYNWNFIWLSAGEVVFEVNETEQDFQISAIGKTYSSYEWFFKVRDYYYTFMDKETMLPHTFIRDIQEGGFTLYDKIKFDQQNQTGTSLRGKNRTEAELHHIKFDQCMHDMLSIVYKMRNLDFDLMRSDTRIPIKIFLDLEEYPLEIAFEGLENGKWVKGLGHFNTVVISPELIAGNVFNEGQKMKIWVSNDSNRVPLIIESPVSVGSVKVILKEYEGLKYPFNSKINP